MAVPTCTRMHKGYFTANEGSYTFEVDSPKWVQALMDANPGRVPMTPVLEAWLKNAPPTPAAAA